MEFDEFYNVKVENNKDLNTSKATWSLSGKIYSTKIKTLAEKFSMAYQNLKNTTCQKIQIESNLVFEIKEDGDNFFIAINDEKVDIEGYKYSLDKRLVKDVMGRIAGHFTIYSKLVEADVCYIVGETLHDNKIAFKTRNDSNFITYRVVSLENWGEGCDELEIIKMFRAYCISNDKNKLFDYVIEGEPSLAVFDDYIYIQNDKFYLAYKQAAMSPVEDVKGWSEHFGNKFDKIEESEVDAKTLAKEVIKVFEEKQEQILKHIPEENKEEFIGLLKN